ncbi:MULTISPECIES: serine O-acetyltransferase [unclassified Hyphomicrobium]|uniref:serine O-acetyltransferase n=1 Tax=unclassified Hyphomicrobium TaxID=2619925 RepID=UPI000213D3C7|nr:MULTISPECIES: serine O-acetyltransferase [unclassified Hyphomicrobium]CCB66844.1 Serine O-acetyltransferase [Hyphomicrobium sp. MC1]
MTADCTKSPTSTVEQRSDALSLLQLIREDIGCVCSRDPAARGELETLLTYPGVHAILWHRLASRLWRSGWRFPARLLSWFARFLTNIDIHPGATLGRRFFIDHGAGVVIGETAEVGDDVTLYHGVTLGGTSWSAGKRHPTLEDGVVVGAGAKILGPITIGRGARVGANSVVIDTTPPGVTVVGIPAKIVYRGGERRKMIGRINLDHHQMPDPVGEAIAIVLDRIEFLEARLSHIQKRLREEPLRLTPHEKIDATGTPGAVPMWEI